MVGFGSQHHTWCASFFCLIIYSSVYSHLYYSLFCFHCTSSSAVRFVSRYFYVLINIFVSLYVPVLIIIVFCLRSARTRRVRSMRRCSTSAPSRPITAALTSGWVTHTHTPRTLHSFFFIHFLFLSSFPLSLSLSLSCYGLDL